MRKSFSALLAALLASAACVSSMALTLDTAETAAEDTNPATELAEAPTPDIPLTSKEYGKLIYYQNMDVESDTTDYSGSIKSNLWTATENIAGGSYYLSGGSYSYAADPTDESNGVMYLSGGDGFHQLVGTFYDFQTTPGTYCLVYDIYNPTTRADSSANPGFGGYMNRFFTKNRNSNDQMRDVYGNYGDKKNDLISNNPSAPSKDTWTTVTETLVLGQYDAGADYNAGYTLGYLGQTAVYFPNTDAGEKDMNVTEFRIIIQNASAYIDNIRIYFVDQNASTFTVNTNTFAVTADDDGMITMPAIDDVCKDFDGKFYGWINSDKLYQPGEKVSVKEAGGLTFTALEVSALDSKFGELIAYWNYEIGVYPGYFNSNYGSNANRSFGASNGIGGVRRKVLSDGITVGEAYPNQDHGNANYAFAKAALVSNAKARYTVYAGVMLPEGVTTKAFDNNSLWVRVAEFDKFFGADKSRVNSDTLTYGYSQKDVDSLSSVGINYSRQKNQLNSYYFDNYAVYAFPTNAILFKTDKTSQKAIKDAIASDASTYTFKTGAEIGINGEFTYWTDGINFYKIGETYNLSDVRYKVFYPFIQSADVPAMGYVFDNNLKTAGTYTELIEDDGRDVLHLHQYKVYNGEQKTWSHDVRLSMYDKSIAFDPKEYPIVEYMYKITKASNVPTEHKANKDYDPETDGAPIATATPEFAFWYATPKSDGSYWIANNGEQKITGGNITAQADGKYHELSYDMRTTKSNSNVPFIDADTVGGFALDPCTSNWENDVYIDYIRVYRSGLTTVTYDTNAPEGATVKTNVAPDTNRGLGTGYLLTGERPEVEGYVFLGWSETKDGTKTVDSITLTGDTTVYAVWKEASKFGTPEADGKVEIKNMGSGTSAIRFSAAVSNVIKSNMDELGFIVTREVLLPKDGENVDYTALTHQLKKKDKNEKLYVEGVAYDKDTDLARGQDEDTADWIYTALCTGIPTEKADETIVIRSYAKYFINGNAVTLYGTPAKNSVKAIAQSIYDAEDKTTYNANKEYIDGILGITAE